MAAQFDPTEERDQCDQAELWFNAPLRAKNKRLSDELATAKKLLRENGIAFPSTPEVPSKKPRVSSGRVTRRSTRTIQLEEGRTLPILPLEIQYMIVGYAMSSDHPIIDPLMPLDGSKLTPQERKWSKNQIAFGCLAACRAFHQEGTKTFWASNTFVFTTHQALRNLGILDLAIRNTICSTTLRIVAQYYDDQRKIRRYNSALPGFPKVRIQPIQRVADHTTLGRRGFKSYSWLQLADFLTALRPPFDPQHDKKQVRPRLLPNLTSLRIDFVNFPNDCLDFPSAEVHQLAAHHLARTLSELVFTGLPPDEPGIRAKLDLMAMVRDDGLVVKSIDTFVCHNGKMAQIADADVQAKVVRSWRSLVHEKTGTVPPLQDSHWHPELMTTTGLGAPIPLETVHPASLWQNRPTMWKLVPVSRDSSLREFIEFSRTTGSPVGKYSEELDVDDSADLQCEDCGGMHEPYDTDF
ncbi:hypothetical protein QBC39DRAFT_365595 [Podospora conica]|nr:hypothetical protein QBC39DRAFT_365595 [Schizothecium conicum]